MSDTFTASGGVALGGGAWFTPGASAPDLHERIALGIQSAIQTLVCPLVNPSNPAYGIAAAQVYYLQLDDDVQDDTKLMFPCVVVSIAEESEEDSDWMGFEDDISVWPCSVSVVDRLDAIDNIKRRAILSWRRQINDMLRAIVTLQGCPEAWNVWAKRRKIFNPHLRNLQCFSSDSLVQVTAGYPRTHT